MDQYFQRKAQDLAYDLETHQTESAADLLREDAGMHPGRTGALIATANQDVQRDAANQRVYPNADHAFIRPDGEVAVKNVLDGHVAFAGRVQTYSQETPGVRPYYAERPPMMVAPVVPILPGISIVVPLGHRRGW